MSSMMKCMQLSKLSQQQSKIKLKLNLKGHKPQDLDQRRTMSLIFQIRHSLLLQIKIKVKAFFRHILKVKRKLRLFINIQSC